MATLSCSRCGAGPAGADLFDHCDLCGLALCDECMPAGCCGQVPAVSRRERHAACPACGAPLGGRAGCQAAFDSLAARSYASPARGAMHNMLVDTYAMQHPEEYGISAKSYIRHLFALACLVEHPGDQRLYWATPARGAAVAAPPKPALLRDRGALTVAHPFAASDDDAYQRAMREWAANVWDAYAPQHDLAHTYMTAVRTAIG